MRLLWTMLNTPSIPIHLLILFLHCCGEKYSSESLWNSGELTRLVWARVNPTQSNSKHFLDSSMAPLTKQSKEVRKCTPQATRALQVSAERRMEHSAHLQFLTAPSLCSQFTEKSQRAVHSLCVMALVVSGKLSWVTHVMCPHTVLTRVWNAPTSTCSEAIHSCLHGVVVP